MSKSPPPPFLYPSSNTSTPPKMTETQSLPNFPPPSYRGYGYPRLPPPPQLPPLSIPSPSQRQYLYTNHPGPYQQTSSELSSSLSTIPAPFPSGPAVPLERLLANQPYTPPRTSPAPLPRRESAVTPRSEFGPLPRSQGSDRGFFDYGYHERRDAASMLPAAPKPKSYLYEPPSPSFTVRSGAERSQPTMGSFDTGPKLPTSGLPLAHQATAAAATQRTGVGSEK